MSKIKFVKYLYRGENVTVIKIYDSLKYPTKTQINIMSDSDLLENYKAFDFIPMIDGERVMLVERENGEETIVSIKKGIKKVEYNFTLESVEIN